jgi:hypothetical protein
MSWYAGIDGEIVTSLKAKPLVMNVIGQWAEPDAEGTVELKEDPGKETLTICLSGLYRNLGRYIKEKAHNIVQEFPQ